MPVKRTLPNGSERPSPEGKPLFSTTVSLVAVLALGGCSGGVLDARGPIGAANAKILLNAVTIMLVIVVPTIVVTLAFAWWFRASNAKARYRPRFAYSGRIELIVWGIPLLVILFLSGVIWIGSHDLDPHKPISARAKPIEVQAVSLDWKWLFIYPEQGVASVNDLVLPVDAPAHFSLTSATVMNMFFVPQLGSMIATMYGMVNELYLKADHVGDYYGQSAQFSGDGFSDMHFIVHAVPDAAFAQWIAKARSAGPALDSGGYLSLLHESQNLAPFTYRSIDASLFQKIVTGQFPPGPGPASEGSGPASRPRGAK